MSKKRSKPEKPARPAPARYSTFALIGAGAVLALALFARFDFYQFTITSSLANRDSYRVGFQHDRLRQLDVEPPGGLHPGLRLRPALRGSARLGGVSRRPVRAGAATPWSASTTR